MKEPIILLDLMYTLVGNMHERLASESGTAGYPAWIEKERMRKWLVRLLKESGCPVLLLTVRQDRWQELSLARIATDTGGWQPHEAYFAPRPMPPAAAKRGMLLQHVFPRHGRPEGTRYLALESNPVTRRMYAGFGIAAVPVPNTPWKSLPLE